ncbi:MAG: acyltransferase [Muribaculaceae bacterium]|nr:acyltransferase [Muribaculaceae bacterium]
MFKTINALRGLFAIVIVLYHSQIYCLESASMLGVSFFLVASGFLLTVRHRHAFDKATAGDWWRFWWRRACRIYPIHWIALAMMVFLIVVVEHKGHTIEWPVLACVATLTQPWVPIKDYFFGINSISWFLGALLFCYACFPTIDRWYSRLRLRWQVLFLTSLMLLLTFGLPMLSSHMRLYTYVCPAVRLGDFLVGVTAGNIYLKVKNTPRNYSTLKSTLIEAAIVLIVVEVLLINLVTDTVDTWDRYLVWWIPVALLVFASAMLSDHEGWLGRLLLLRPLQWLGKVSFEVYIFQTVVAIIVNYTVSPLLGHFGIMAYDKYLYSQLPLLLLLAGVMHWLRSKPRRAAVASPNPS